MSDQSLIKMCLKCKVEKPFAAFPKDKNRKDGLNPYCKPCVAIINKKYRDSHKEQTAERGRIYRENNKESISKWQKQYRENNKELVAQRKKEYYENNKEYIIQYQKEYAGKNKEKTTQWQKTYRENNKEKITQRHKEFAKNNRAGLKHYKKEYYIKNRESLLQWHREYSKTDVRKTTLLKAKHKRRALKLQATVEDFSPSEIFERDNYICQLCGCKTRPDYKSQYHPKYPNLDHIIPLSKGGDHSRKNTQCLCFRCNMEKNNTGTGDQLRMFG